MFWIGLGMNAFRFFFFILFQHNSLLLFTPLSPYPLILTLPPPPPHPFSLCDLSTSHHSPLSSPDPSILFPLYKN
ncbi:hypothetical protein DM01DRAFT_1095026 [Hesseltinella vesiculosa]|uniref:Uncharacterized protein n=1 Tax=Hesseltinella vesiculosa TaxID=101127 RepID=A0A1X2GC67_9FUNG|nr:hypothetical protein DM01DRAFT_1095026 [Hesseltinella vesiculosa]